MNQELIQEYIKCSQDPVYFANNYGYVFDMKRQQISKMNCFPYQEDCLRTFNDNQNSIVLKSRQMGLSVISAMYVAWRLVFCFDERMLVVADNGNGAVRFLNTVRQVLDRLPDWMLPDERLINNTKQISFSNGSWVKAVASSKQAGRGESLTCLILDETAFIEHAQDIWMGEIGRASCRERV
jgi:phage terminase large subunit GpA-like protein